MLFVAAALASSAPSALPAASLPPVAVVDSTATAECVHPYAASFHPDLPRCAPRLSDAAYTALDRRHKRAAALGFTVSGLGIPAFALGAGIAALSFGGYPGGGYANGWTALGVNVMGIGLAAHVAGAVVGFRSAGLYDREYDELFDGSVRPEDLVARGCNLKIHPTVSGLGGTF